MNAQSEDQTDKYGFLSGKHWIADPVQAVFMSAPRRALFRELMQANPERILDVCCGTGGMAARFTGRGIETVGVDASISMLERAKRKSRVSLGLLMDAVQMNFNKEFDAAYINLAIHEMSPDVREQVWQSMVRSVRKGGTLAVMDLNASGMDTRRSRFWRAFFELDERNFLNTNPEHYSNYREFMENGGLKSWMSKRVSGLSSEHYFFAGNIAVLSTTV